MKKKKLSDISTKSSITYDDEMIFADGKAKGGMIDMVVSVSAGTEVDLGFSTMGLYLLTMYGGGHNGLFFLPVFVNSAFFIAGTNIHFSVDPESENRFALYRKVNSGNLFLRNNKATNATLRIQGIVSRSIF